MDRAKSISGNYIKHFDKSYNEMKYTFKEFINTTNELIARINDYFYGQNKGFSTKAWK